MAFSVKTNPGAMAALQSLTATNRQMETTQSRINSGFNVASTADDSAKYTVAQNLRGDLGKLTAVTNSLNNAKSVTDVAVAGAEQISDILNQMKSKTQEAADAGLDQDSRDAIAKDLTALKAQIFTIIDGSDFNGKNVLKKDGGEISALQSFQNTGSGTDYVADSLTVDNLELDDLFALAIDDGGFGDKDDAIELKGTDAVPPTDPNDPSTGVAATSGSDAAAKLMSVVDKLAETMNGHLSDLGAASRKIDGQIKFTSKLTDVVTSGIGNLVDADLAKESANLQALQVQQQLGVQALSIANQAPQTILSLFR